MKYADDPTFPAWLVAHPQIANQLAEHKYIKEALDYLLDVGYQKDEELLVAFEQTAPKLQQTMLTTRQQIEQRGERRGRQEGRQEGRREGRREGRQKGRQEGLQLGVVKGRIAIAKQMLVKGIDKRLISEVTGLSVEEVNKRA